MNQQINLMMFLVLTAMALTLGGQSLKGEEKSVVTPKWDYDNCHEIFTDQDFELIYAAKTLKRADGSAYSLITGRKADKYDPAGGDIYKSELTGGSFGETSLVSSLNGVEGKMDVTVVGNKIYVADFDSSGVVACDWNDVSGVAGNCSLEEGSGVNEESPESLNYHDGYMYYSGGDVGGVKKLDMSSYPWQNSPEGPMGWNSQGVYVADDFAIVGGGVMITNRKRLINVNRMSLVF